MLVLVVLLLVRLASASTLSTFTMAKAAFHTIGAFAAAAMVAVHLHRPEVFPDFFAIPGGFPHPVERRELRRRL